MPEGSRTAKGSHIVNLLQLQEGEKVTLMLQQKAGVDEDNTYATMVTKQGLIKRTPLSQFRNIRKMGLIAIALNEGDSLVWSHLTKVTTRSLLPPTTARPSALPRTAPARWAVPATASASSSCARATMSSVQASAARVRTC